MSQSSRKFARLPIGLVFLITTSVLADEKPAPTYHKEISRLIQKHCQDCHRPGQVAPFSLMNYDQARKRSADLAYHTAEKRMPPWPASTTYGGPFRDERVLTADEIAVFQEWDKAGAPEGDPKDAPKERTYSSDWALGKPDLIVTMPEPYTLPASGDDEFRVFVLPTNFPEDRWIKAVDFKPGNRSVVHHILAGVDNTGRGRELDAQDPKPGYSALGGFGPGVNVKSFLPIWTPGALSRFCIDETGYLLPKGADILIQVHYHKTGKPETDASSVAVYLSNKPLMRMVDTGFVFPSGSDALREKTRQRVGKARPNMNDYLYDILDIKPGDKNFTLKTKIKLDRGPYDQDILITSVMPHMHWLGTDFTFTAITPDEKRIPLIKIDRWDFNWQGTYGFKEPVLLPRGSTLEVEAHFDNSESNPFNQNKPPKEVHWGDGTNDEMCIGIFEWVPASGEKQERGKRVISR